MRTTLAARMQFGARSCRSRAWSAGLLKVYDLKIGAMHRNRFAARVLELLKMAALTELSAAPSNRCCGFVRVCALNGRDSIEPWLRRPALGRRFGV
jgi:hypothetical protein